MKERDYTHGLEIADAGSLSNSKLQDLKMALEVSKINFEQQQLELKDLNEQLKKTVISAPLNGIITNLQVEEGEIAVSATSGFQGGTSIGSISDISKLEVISSIGEADYTNIRLNQKVRLHPVATDSISTEGTITFLAISAKRRNNDIIASFEVRISIDSVISGIAPGMNVVVEYSILQKDSVLGVPCHFIYKKNGNTYVNLIKTAQDGKEHIENIKVLLGETDYKNFEIRNGLTLGDILIYTQSKENTTSTNM